MNYHGLNDISCNMEEKSIFAKWVYKERFETFNCFVKL